MIGALPEKPRSLFGIFQSEQFFLSSRGIVERIKSFTEGGELKPGDGSKETDLTQKGGIKK